MRRRRFDVCLGAMCNSLLIVHSQEPPLVSRTARRNTRTLVPVAEAHARNLPRSRRAPARRAARRRRLCTCLGSSGVARCYRSPPVYSISYRGVVVEPLYQFRAVRFEPLELALCLPLQTGHTPGPVHHYRGRPTDAMAEGRRRRAAAEAGAQWPLRSSAPTPPVAAARLRAPSSISKHKKLVLADCSNVRGT